MKTIWVVILNFNGGKDTIDCIASLKKSLIHGFEQKILVVDNASQDSSVKQIKKQFPDIEIVENKINKGFSSGMNAGIIHALSNGAEYVMLLNNDTVVDKTMTEELFIEAEKDRKNLIISPKIYFAKGSEYHKDRYKKEELGKVIWYAGAVMDWANIIGYHRGVDEVDRGQYDVVTPIDFASGCCMLISKIAFDAIGLLDDRYFLYYEDSDFSERVRKAGYTIVYAPQAIMWHKNAGSAGGSGSAMQDYYITRNRMLFGMTYGSVRSKIALIKESITILKKGRMWQKTGVKDYYLRRFGKGSFHI